MNTRLLLGAILALCSASSAEAQVRAVINSPVSVVPSFATALAPGPVPSFSETALSLPLSSVQRVPIPALFSSVIPAAAVAFQPSFVPTDYFSGAASSKEAGRALLAGQPHGEVFKDLKRLVGMVAADAAPAAFDGSTAKSAPGNVTRADRPLPLGAKGVSVVRLKNAHDAATFIPDTPITAHFIRELAKKWDEIGWLDLRVYTDAQGGRFRTVDLSGRPHLAEHLPEVEPHEVKLIRKIQLHSKDLQFVIREEGKTPDLIVDGVLTEMKSLFMRLIPVRSFMRVLVHANAQVFAHAARHQLGPGAIAFDLTLRDVVPAAELLDIINNYIRTGAEIGFASVSVYAGKDRRLFVRQEDGLFDLQNPIQLITESVKTSSTFRPESRPLPGSRRIRPSRHPGSEGPHLRGHRARKVPARGRH